MAPTAVALSAGCGSGTLPEITSLPSISMPARPTALPSLSRPTATATAVDAETSLLTSAAARLRSARAGVEEARRTMLTLLNEGAQDS
ncbi:hypothetical protein H5398_04900 [Tessaracoccus sp. MC1679]|uniref:hypothetical protein n=1 Tax=Tessaracoccus sp. MC1679 TaxID=2760313 RepID=UPI001602635E|nr:hypothetical protein [Tessaracoccus sp. MC1679]MBB1515315.1 hypothetical protein [Tessaracoccus sp. MC1679]